MKIKKSQILFWNKYRIQSIRKTWHDYSWSWSYFITVCTKFREYFFWKIKNGYMCLSNEGSICRNNIYETNNMRENISIDHFVVMPNHIHLLIEIKQSRRDALHASPSSISTWLKFWPQSNNIPAIVRWIKWSITSQIHTFNPWFSRQSRYHDHIIRNQKEKNMIIEYIVNNVSHRKKDSFY